MITKKKPFSKRSLAMEILRNACFVVFLALLVLVILLFWSDALVLKNAQEQRKVDEILRELEGGFDVSPFYNRYASEQGTVFPLMNNEELLYNVRFEKKGAFGALVLSNMEGVAEKFRVIDFPESHYFTQRFMNNDAILKLIHAKAAANLAENRTGAVTDIVRWWKQEAAL